MNQPKQQICKTSYFIKIGEAEYITTISTLKNSPSGCPRYNALITPLERIKTFNNKLCYSFNFRGSYCGEYEEAQQITEYLHRKLKGE